MKNKIKTLYEKLKNKVEIFFDKTLITDIHQFKPSIVEVQDSPASPFGRAVAWILCLIIFIAILWSCMANIDIIAVSQGKIVPVGNTKIIQSNIDGTIKSIKVKDGSYVKKGDILIELDTESLSADLNSLIKQFEAESVKLRRSNSMLLYIDKGLIEKPKYEDLKSINNEMQQLLFIEEYKDLESSLNMLQDSLNQKNHELNNINKNIEHYTKTLDMMKDRSRRIKILLDKDMASKMEYMEFEEKQIREQNELDNLNSKKNQTLSIINEIKEKIIFTKIENKKKHLLQVEESFNLINRINEEIQKNKVVTKYSNIKAPVSGIVQELKFHTVGGVIEMAQEVLKIVEENSDIEVEAFILGKDIGFIKKGLPVAVKIDSFLFTKYGVVDGIVENISEDAISDEKLGLIYKTKVRLLEKEINVDGKKIKLSYGMGVTAEIKTGTRKVIEFFLSPITKAANESIRER